MFWVKQFLIVWGYQNLVLNKKIQQRNIYPAEKIVQDTPLSRPISYLKVQETTTSLLYDIWRDNGLI